MFVYILESTVDHSQYVGMSENPLQRLKEHNAGAVRSTARKRPWIKIYLEECPNRLAAREREKYLKSAAGRRFRKTLQKFKIHQGS
jgi:putative endonuclease